MKLIIGETCKFCFNTNLFCCKKPINTICLCCSCPFCDGWKKNSCKNCNNREGFADHVLKFMYETELNKYFD